MATTTAMATQMEMLTASSWLPFPSYEADRSGSLATHHGALP